MHIPDGFLSLYVIIPTFIITIIFWAISVKKVKLTEQQIPIMGLLTALFFAAMMMNYPIIGGTTAHLLGGATIGLILGPFAGCISITIILVLQAFLFGDGGLTALGANVLNMGIIGIFVPCIIFLSSKQGFQAKNNHQHLRNHLHSSIRRRCTCSNFRRHRTRLIPASLPIRLKRSCTSNGNQPLNNRRRRRHSHSNHHRHATETASRRTRKKPHIGKTQHVQKERG